MKVSSGHVAVVGNSFLTGLDITAVFGEMQFDPVEVAFAHIFADKLAAIDLTKLNKYIET